MTGVSHPKLLMFPDMVEFSDEEGYGKYLDLHECFDKYLQLKGIEVWETLHHSIKIVKT